jgi:hypothetical protein
MTKSAYFIVAIILSVLMIGSCGQRGDLHNPLGLTGGGDGGYGGRQDIYQSDSVIPQNDNSVEGIWTGTENTLTIKSDGSFELKSAEDIRTGKFSKDKVKLTLNFENGQSITYNYSLDKGWLTLEEIE